MSSVTSTVSSSSSPSSHFFTTPISLKLSEENVLLWKQQVFATTDGLLLSHFLDGSRVPSSILPPATEGSSPCVNPEFTRYKQQDSLLVAWMFASMTTPFLTKMVDLHSFAQIWDVLHTYFAANTRAQIKKFRLRLKKPKNERSVSTYLLDIKKTVDLLAAIGAPVSVEDHVETIF